MVHEEEGSGSLSGSVIIGNQVNVSNSEELALLRGSKEYMSRRVSEQEQTSDQRMAFVSIYEKIYIAFSAAFLGDAECRTCEERTPFPAFALFLSNDRETKEVDHCPLD